MASVRAWQPLGTAAEASWPEDALPDVSIRPPTGIAFSGGGTRAMVAAWGALSALHQLGLLERDVRYISGISGGSWATATFTYAQLGAPSVAPSDDVLLGTVLEPENISMESLNVMDDSCLRALATFRHHHKHGLRTPLHGPISRLATDSVYRWLLEPLGVTRAAYMGWNKQTVADIRLRNPHLVNASFVVPPASARRPYPILGCSVIGPLSGAPFQWRHRKDRMRMLEVTPLYVGRTPFERNLTVYPRGGGAAQSYSVGGLVESFAFGSTKPPAASGLLPAGSASGLLRVPLPPRPFALENATTASSYFPAEAWAELGPRALQRTFDFVTGYWSPAAGAINPSDGDSAQTILGDGGDLENIHLIGLLTRRCRSIILFVNTVQPLHGSSQWDPATELPTTARIEDDLPAFFGVHVLPADATEAADQMFALDFSANQVFPTAEFAPLVEALQAAQAGGKPAVVTRQLTTVANDRWGVASGWELNLTVCYLSRIAEWERRLPADVRDMVQPNSTDPYIDMGETIQRGPFAHFPHFDTSTLLYDTAKANLLANFAGWSVLQNAELFRQQLRI